MTTSVLELRRRVSLRHASRQTGIPGRVLLRLLIEAGFDVTRIGRRVLVIETDIEKLMQANVEMPAAVAKSRAELVRDLAEREVFGDRGPRCRRTREATR